MKLKLWLIAAIAATILAMTSPPAQAREPFYGEIMMVGNTFCPRGWAEADGQLLPIARHSALFALYETNYGGDGRTTFALPDLRGRVAMHVGHGEGLTQRHLAQKAGQERVTIRTENMPSHNHLLNVTDEEGDTGSPVDAGFAASLDPSDTYSQSADTLGKHMQSDVVAEVGGSQPLGTLPPFQVVRFCVSLGGVFPSRN